MINRLALFASGSGTNVENIFNYFIGNNQIKIEVILCNNKDAVVLKRAKRLKIQYLLFDSQITSDEEIITFLKSKKITHIILAGYLKLIPKKIIENFDQKIINIHPALLPKFGGKGYYGDKVHASVLESKELFSGITIHLVNENYDEGKILFQKKIKINSEDTVATLSKKIHKLEYEYFPQIVEKYILNKL